MKFEDLDRITERMRKVMSLREGSAQAKITVHMGTCGLSAGARKIMKELMACADKSAAEVIFSTSGCAGLCSREPMITVELAGQAPVKYVDLTEDKARRIFTEHVVNGKIVAEYALAIGSEQTI
jgi:NADP-reducing hydrogenase subunit HndB